MKLLLVFVCAVVITTCVSGDKTNFDEIIRKVNSNPKSTWKAGKNFQDDIPRSYIQQLGSGVRSDYLERAVLSMQKPEKGAGALDIPDNFDAREAWPDCPSIKRIINQSRCGSCWAVSIAETLTDRYCIHKNIHFNVSAEDLLTCCKSCGGGCNGGYPQQALQYYVEEGIVSGGFYGSNKGCKPYTIAPCHIDEHNSCDLVPTPKCIKKCRAGFPKSYEQDKKSGRVAYQIEPSIEKIQREIMRNGPVQAAFIVYEDFYAYKSGVYKHDQGKRKGGHAVKVIGWGVENGVEYWLVANSWGTQWGEHGYFKVARSIHGMKFEEQMNGAIP